MPLVEINSPADRKKLIVAIVLGVIAVAVLSYALFGSSGSAPAKPGPNVSKTATPQRQPASGPVGAPLVVDDVAAMQPIIANWGHPAVAEPRRNIFAFYEPLPPPVKVVPIPVPSPTPTPPLLLASLSPANVYARTADFTMEISGDKFTPAVRIVIDNRELPTRFIGPQQLAATVPASVIANPGTRQVVVRTSDSVLYSNVATLNVATPPIPNYNYVGIIGKRHFNDWAVLQDKNSKDIVNVQRGDVLGGRFRVTSISERELVVMDTTLKIKHTLPFTRDPSLGNQMRPPQRAETDEEP
ncbi:MAG: hypothetical protein QOD75_2940 [Blastocatellia bacterium]|jgi:hypothetical protein|nr:hypothetical protein [Blastocatellia bacterium]